MTFGTSCSQCFSDSVIFVSTQQLEESQVGLLVTCPKLVGFDLYRSFLHLFKWDTRDQGVYQR